MSSILQQLRQHWIALSVTAGLLLSYTLAGFLLVPHLARSAATEFVEQKLGRHLSLGELRFNPYTFEAQITDLKLTEADDAPLIGFASLRVNAEPFASLFHRAITLKELHLTAPSIALVIGQDGSVNLSQLVPPSEAAPATTEPAALPRIRIGRLAVDNGRIGLEDRSRPQPFAAELTPIQFALTDFRTEAAYENVYRFDAQTAAGEQFSWSGRFTVQPLGSSGDFKVAGLLAKTVDAYLQTQLPVALGAGRIDLNGSYRFALQPTLELGIELPVITLSDFAITARGQQNAAAPVAVKRIGIEQLAFSLQQRELSINTVKVDGAQLDVHRNSDGTINLLQLLPPDNSPEPTQTADPATPATPWRIAVAHLRLNDAAVRAEDRSVRPAARFTLAPINLSVDDYSSDAAAILKINTDIVINDSGQLRAQGTARLQPLSTQLALQLENLGLPAAQPYLSQATKATLHGGVLGVNGNLDYSAPEQGPPQLRFRGDIKVADLRASGGGEGAARRDDFARWKNLDISGIDFQQTPDRLTVERVTLRQPFARVVINADQSLNIAQILAPPTPASAATTPAAAKPAGATPMMPIRIKQIRIEQGAAFFADRSIEPAFATGIVSLNGNVSNLSSDTASRANIKLQGQVDRHSPVEISGTSSLLAATEHSDIKLAFRGMELTTFNPYSGKFAGYNISKGKLTTELAYKIDKRQLEAEHHIKLDQLEFGDATHSKDAAPLPIKLAIALLKDRHGVIDLDLPVRGSLDDPQFRYGKIVWQVLTNVLTKIVTAPFAALGSLFGGGEELSFIDFAAGSPALTASASDKLAKLGTALSERPQLKLDVPITVSSNDKTALARAALAERIPADSSEDKPRLRALQKVYKELAKDSAKFPDGVDEPAARIAFLEPLVLNQLAPSEEALQRLARQRARAVQDSLLAQPDISAERIFITTDRAAASGDEGAVRMELKLQ